MTERNQRLFPLILELAVLAICGVFFGLFTWLSQPYVPADPADDAASEAPIADALSEIDGIPAGTYRYGGSATMVPIRQAIESLVKTDAPQFQLNYVNPLEGAPNSTLGIDRLLSGELAFVDASRAIKPEEYEAAEQLGFELQQTPVAIDGIAITVHPRLDIKGLTIEQLRDIYLGNISNWYEVGGPDLAIRPFSMLPTTSGTASFFVQSILKGEPLSQRVEITNETTPVLRQITSIPGSIYYVSAPLAIPQCSVKTLPIASAEGRPFVAPYQVPQVDASDCPKRRNRINKDAFRNGTYPLTRRLFVVSKKGDSSEAIAGLAYSDIVLSAEGQILVEEAGFVSVR